MNTRGTFLTVRSPWSNFQQGACHTCPGVELRIWLKQGEEKSLLARILKILEEARKRLSQQNSTKNA